MIYYIAKIIESICLFKIPLVSSIHGISAKDETQQRKWILHWILLGLIVACVWPVLNFLEPYISTFLVSIIRILLSAGVLFHERLVGNLVYDQLEVGFKLANGLVDTFRGRVREAAKKLCTEKPCETKK